MVEINHSVLGGAFPTATSSSTFFSSSSSSSSVASSSSVSSISVSTSSTSSSTSFVHLQNPTQNVAVLPPVQEIPDIDTPEVFPLYAIIITAFLAFIMTSSVFYFLCRCIAKRKRRRNQLSTMTPKPADPRMAGVRADQTIQFVVPTTIVVSETTEDSLSDTDYSSSGSRFLPVLTDASRRKRPASGFHINPEDLEKGLYEGISTGPEIGTFLGDLGKIGFSLHYNYLRNHLCVKIIGATHLPCLFLKTTANPCVKLTLLPDRSPKYITKVQKNTMHPVFNETFLFPVRKDDLDGKKIKISVFDYDRFSRKLLIGQVIYAIKDAGITGALSGDVITGDIWIDLRKESETKLDKSVATELLFSLCYNPESSSLTLTVLKTRGLLALDKEKETAVVYAKVTLYVRRKLVRTKKSSSKRKLPDMEFNNTFHIHVPQGALSEVDLLVTLCEKSGISGKRTIGRTQVGSNCISIQGLQHWQDMINSPRSTCAQWHFLSG